MSELNNVQKYEEVCFVCTLLLKGNIMWKRRSARYNKVPHGEKWFCYGNKVRDNK